MTVEISDKLNRFLELILVVSLTLFVGCKSSNSTTYQINKSADNLRVASYNIRIDVKGDVTSGNGWDLRKKPISEFVKRNDFDIIGIQEPLGNQLNQLQVLLPSYDYISAPYAVQSFLAIFYKKDEFDLLGKGRFWLSETPDIPSMGWDSDEYRIVHWGKFRHKTSGKEFYCFNSHFYWKRVTARQNSGPLVAKKIKEIAGDNPVILMGDLNSKPETSQIASIKEVLNDVAEVTQTPRKGPEKTAFPGGVFTGEPTARIDYIFVSKDMDVLNYTVYDDTYGEHGRFPSDHFPISSEIVIK